MIRFEILLPLFFNDGRQIDAERFALTDDELMRDFGAASYDQISVRGKWTYQSTVYSDQLVRIRIDVDDTPENWTAMRQTKERLKERFEQLDIWITAHRIDVL